MATQAQQQGEATALETQQQGEEQDEQQQGDRRDRDTASTPDVATSVRIANAVRC